MAAHPPMPCCIVATALLTLGLASQAHAAPGHLRAGDYTIDYNALTGNALPRVSTRKYHLRHTSDQGLVTITVNTGQAAAATNVPFTVRGHATTLLGQPVPIKIRYVNDDQGDYSALVTFHVSSTETVRFDLDVTPTGGATTHLRFVHSFES